MKIYMYISDLGAGGAERVCVNLANEFVNYGNEVTIITLNLVKDVYSQILDDRVKVHSLEVPRIRYAIIPIVAFLKKEKAERILVFGNEMGIILAGMRSVGLLRCKIAVRVLNNIEIEVSKEENVSFFVRRVLKYSQKNLQKADCIIAQCHAMEDMLQKNIGFKKCICIYNPVSSFLVQNTKLVRETNGARKRIGFIGRLDPQKNIGDLIQAFILLCKNENNVTLHIYGEGIHYEKARKMTADLGISDKVFFEGVHNDMENVYSRLDMVALSSDYEGMPNALIEAVSIGIPVVSYDCPIGPSEIIVDGVNGYLIPMSDVEALAEGMKKCLNKQWDVNAIRKSAAKFDVKDTAKEYEKVLMEM